MWFFRQFLIFCKKLVNTNEKLIPEMESPDFFWSHCQISCLGKVWFIQKWGLMDSDWRIFCDFWPYWMNQYSKSTCVTKMIFWTLKEILEDYSPRKSQPQSLNGSWNKAASVFKVFEWSQKIFWNICFFFIQNRSIRKNNMFWAIFERPTFSLM